MGDDRQGNAAWVVLRLAVSFRDSFGMRHDDAIAKLKRHEADLRRLGVEHLFLFGSMARDEARPDSDVDLFFDYPRGRFGLYELIDVEEAAASILACKAEIMTRDSIHKRLRANIEAVAIPVF